MPIPVEGGLAGIKEGFELLPAGTYEVEVADAEEGVAGPDAKFPGKPKINIEMHVTEEEYAGRRLWINLSFTENALGMVKSNLRALGYTDDDFADPNFTVDADDLVGRKCKALVNIRRNEKTKEDTNNVRRLLPLSEEESELPG